MSGTNRLLPWTRGRLIALEGAVGVGKTSLRRALASDMERYGLPVRLVDPPEAFDLGGRLLHALTSSSERVEPTCRLFTRLAVYAQLAAASILPELALGRWVIVESYLDALVVEAAARGWLPARDMAVLANAAAQGATPDLTLYIDCEAGETRERWLRQAEVASPRIVVVPAVDAPTVRRMAFGHVRQYIMRAGQA